ncbi:hypothetical protein GQ42DRAFT_7693 [Ramicandelaber brevisporus]|nr:hypothetical protein GQ42DRAFT_7693 [Ramicandelaber brevisporus]
MKTTGLSQPAWPPEGSPLYATRTRDGPTSDSAALYPGIVPIGVEATSTTVGRQCLGVVLSSGWIAAPARCVAPSGILDQGNPNVVHILSFDTQTGAAISVNPEVVLPHPQFTSASHVNDIALMRFSAAKSSSSRGIRDPRMMLNPSVTSQIGSMSAIGWSGSTPGSVDSIVSVGSNGASTNNKNPAVWTKSQLQRADDGECASHNNAFHPDANSKQVCAKLVAPAALLQKRSIPIDMSCTKDDSYPNNGYVALAPTGSNKPLTAVGFLTEWAGEVDSDSDGGVQQSCAGRFLYFTHLAAYKNWIERTTRIHQRNLFPSGSDIPPDPSNPLDPADPMDATLPSDPGAPVTQPMPPQQAPGAPPGNSSGDASTPPEIDAEARSMSGGSKATLGISIASGVLLVLIAVILAAYIQRRKKRAKKDSASIVLPRTQSKHSVGYANPGRGATESGVAGMDGARGDSGEFIMQWDIDTSVNIVASAASSRQLYYSSTPLSPPFASPPQPSIGRTAAARDTMEEERHLIHELPSPAACPSPDQLFTYVSATAAAAATVASAQFSQRPVIPSRTYSAAAVVDHDVASRYRTAHVPQRVRMGSVTGSITLGRSRINGSLANGSGSGNSPGYAALRNVVGHKLHMTNSDGQLSTSASKSNMLGNGTTMSPLQHSPSYVSVPSDPVMLSAMFPVPHQQSVTLPMPNPASYTVEMLPYQPGEPKSGIPEQPIVKHSSSPSRSCSNDTATTAGAQSKRASSNKLMLSNRTSRLGDEFNSDDDEDDDEDEIRELDSEPSLVVMMPVAHISLTASHSEIVDSNSPILDAFLKSP